MHKTSKIRWKVLAIRVVLSLFFSYFLIHFFIPQASNISWLIASALFLFFAYVFEAAHNRDKEKIPERGEVK